MNCFFSLPSFCLKNWVGDDPSDEHQVISQPVDNVSRNDNPLSIDTRHFERPVSACNQLETNTLMGKIRVPAAGSKIVGIDFYGMNCTSYALA